LKIKYIVGATIIVVFIIWAGISFNKTLTPYVSLSDAKKTQSIVQVKGKRINNGTIDMDKNLFIFTMEDDRGERVEVVYDGAKPGNFEQTTEVVCVGQYKNGKFYAKELLVKCPSKYIEEGVKA
jgi:cytochrome c-type biogenesis protein CcmE